MQIYPFIYFISLLLVLFFRSEQRFLCKICRSVTDETIYCHNFISSRESFVRLVDCFV